MIYYLFVSLTLLFSSALVAETLPYRQQAEAEVCAGEEYIHPADMQKKVGTKDCIKQLAVHDCKSHTQGDCIVKSPYKAVAKSSLDPMKIREGQKILGVDGKMNANNHNSPCTASLQKDCQILEPYTALDKKLLVGSNIKDGATILGVQGTYKDPDPQPPCSEAVVDGCFLSGRYTAVGRDLLKPANVKAGVTIALVKGAFPSKAFPLDTFQPGNDNLSATEFYSALTNTESYNYFTRTGQQYQLTAVPNLKAENIKDGLTVLGVLGTAKPLEEPDYQKVRFKTGLYGGKGKMKLDCRSAFPAGHDMSNPHGSIDDTGDTKATTYKWGVETQCTEALWEDVSKNTSGQKEPCSSAKTDCVFRNVVTGLLWYKDATKNTASLSQAKAQCGGIPVTDGKKWRVPTHRELLQAYVHRIRYLPASAQFLDPQGSYWSSSTRPHSDARKSFKELQVRVASGKTDYSTDSGGTSGKVLCVK